MRKKIPWNQSGDYRTTTIMIERDAIVFEKLNNVIGKLYWFLK